MTVLKELPASHNALVCAERGAPLTVETRATPAPTPGSAVVRILRATLLASTPALYASAPSDPVPAPLFAGAIGRVAAVGSDATALRAGQLVFVDTTSRNYHDASATAPLETALLDTSYQQYRALPLAALHALDEPRLLGDPGTRLRGLGHTIDDVLYLGRLAAPFGALRALALQPGETALVQPATGAAGGAAVTAALALGAGRVLAVGRRAAALERLVALDVERVVPVLVRGDGGAEDGEAYAKCGKVDALLDMSTADVAGAPLLKAGLGALRAGGRACLMGGVRGDVALPYEQLVAKGITVKGHCMGTREDLAALIRLAERGLLPLGPRGGVAVKGLFELEEWEWAFDVAKSESAFGAQVMFAP